MIKNPNIIVRRALHQLVVDFDKYGTWVNYMEFRDFLIYAPQLNVNKVTRILIDKGLLPERFSRQKKAAYTIVETIISNVNHVKWLHEIESDVLDRDSRFRHAKFFKTHYSKSIARKEAKAERAKFEKRMLKVENNM